MERHNQRHSDQKTRLTVSTVSVLALCISVSMFSLCRTAEAQEQQSASQAGYDEMVSIFDQLLEIKRSGQAQYVAADADVDASEAAARLFPEFGDKAIFLRNRNVQALQDRLEKIEIADWSVSSQVDYLAVRSRLDQYEFTLTVSRPWSRDPGFYVDRLRRPTFASLPLDARAEHNLRIQLQAIPHLVRQAKQNLNEVASDYADLALFNLSNADGVGHGYPYRAQPPAGVLGWYRDLLARAKELQPDLIGDIETALVAVQDFNQWLQKERPRMNGRAGVGKAHFNWYLKHVKLMPWSTNDIVVLGERELDRLWSVYALAQHNNRQEPPISLPTSSEEYAQRLVEVDSSIRDFLVKQDIITVPGYVGKLATNVPWIEREEGPNFWEQVQYRNPAPDHFHAVIPGHRFDALVERNSTHPIRRRLTSGARAEGWATYLEEAMFEAGFETDPRVRELIYIFGIFRAARVPADVWLQLNEMSVDEVVDYWLERVPYLDRNVARVDAEIYLRRPPGYGLGYTIGMLQMQRLLGARKRQLGDAFELRQFHDDFMAAGRLPISLIRWEMTGLDDEVSLLWPRQRLSSVSE